jgi:hypothetical protein
MLLYQLPMAQRVTQRSDQRYDLLRGRQVLQARETGHVGDHPPRSAGQARTASVSVRGRTRNTPGAYGRIADSAKLSRDR